MSLFKKLVVIRGFFEIIGMVQFLGNELFLGLMSDCDNGLLVPAEVMDGEVVPYRKEFSEWNGWGAKNIFSLKFDLSVSLQKKARQSVMIDGLLLCTRGEK